MHSLAVHLAPVLAAEKSKVPFYIAGGLLVAWALIVSLGVGMRREDFPGNIQAQRLVIAITAVLVLAAVSTAVLTSGGAAKSAAASRPARTTGNSELPTPSATATQPAGSATPPTATTGTPAPASSPVAKATALKLAADPGGGLSYDAKKLSAKAGEVTITLTNASPVEHNVTIAQGATVIGSTPSFTGASKRVTVTLKRGTYTFYCSVPGHRQAGMEGTLTVS